jgi:hypothetical protein
MHKKLVVFSAKFLKMHNVAYIGNEYFKTAQNGILTYSYVFQWLKTNGAPEFCSECLFKKFISQLVFEIEVVSKK